MSAPFILHPDAFADLDEIREFIAADDPDAADRFLAEIEDRIGELTRFPHQGAMRPDIAPRTVRFTFVRDYLIAYLPDRKPLTVVAIVHGRRSPRVIAALLRSRH